MKPSERGGGVMQRGAALASEPIESTGIPWDQHPRDEHGYDHRSPMLVRALEHNREVARAAARKDAEAVSEARTAYALDTITREPPRPPEQPAVVALDPEPVPIPPRTVCHLWIGRERRYCGSPVGVRRFVFGMRCDEHSPPQPNPDPALTITGLRIAKGLPPVAAAPPRSASRVVDDRAVRSGKRRSTPEAYREAQDRARRRT